MLSLYWFLSIVIDHKPAPGSGWSDLGVGLEVKYLILPLIAGIAIAVLLTPS